MTPQAFAALNPDEQEALRKLTTMGYRIIGDQVCMTISDEPDVGWEGRKVGPWRGTMADLYEALSAHGFPHTENITCGYCKTNEVEFIGDPCFSCGVELAVEDRGESELSIRRGK